MPPQRYNPTAQEIQRTAREVVRALAEHEFKCCLIGSTASAIYGAENRNPHDVDVVILNADECEVEDIKLLIENNASDFYLVPSKDPEATHQILWYTLTPQYRPDEHGHRACKVDLLIPGILGIPPVPLEKVYHDTNFPDIPLMPFLPLLLLKVRSWAEHRVDHRLRMRARVASHEEDIRELLDLGVNEYVVRVKKMERYLPKVWVQEMTEYVKKYVELFPRSQGMWEEIGFVIKSAWSLPPED